MGHIIKYIIICGVFCNVSAQTCKHVNLSREFDIYTSFQRYTDIDSAVVSISVLKKNGSEIYKITHGSTWFFEGTFIKCENVRSYTTGYNQHDEIIDNEYGDIIVADFNFDNRDDIAVKRDSRGNGGTTDIYYINTGDSFIPDKFLSNNVEFFPARINSKTRTLTTLVHANAYQLSKTIYSLKDNGKWVQVKRDLINYDHQIDD